ncbi:MAG: CPBP family intramembrane metalloprotease [Bacteroidetes bacterium]|nr:CPBP family intramembrane metalloprotease [Bacteroidota bacterium]
MTPSTLNTYFRQTRGLVYSYVFALPLVFLYELLIRISQPGQDQMVRIAVDVWFRMLFTYAGLDALTATLVITAAVGGVIIYSKRKTLPTLKGRYFLWMLAECLLYALFFAILISQFLDLLLNMNSQESLNQLTKLQLFALSLGAGLYEELFFRVILVSGLFFLFNLISDKTAISYSASVVLAALLFSGVHYVGNFADSWAIEGFLFRFLFGLTLNVIYVIRGFGCAAWTHAIYDLIIVFRL